MSWSIDFVPYTDISGAATHTITDIHTLDIDPKTITGVDYFKQEKRFATFSFFSDTWTDNYIIPFVNGLFNYITESYYCSYVVRIKYNDQVEYIGYMKRDLISYDEEFGVMTIKAIDTSGLIFEIATDTKFDSDTLDVYGNPTGILITSVEELIENVGLDITVTNNSSLIEGIEATQFGLYNKSLDKELENSMNDLTGTFEDFNWNDRLPLGYPTLGETKTPKRLSAIYEYDGKLSVVLAKWICRVEDEGDGNATLTETLLVRCYDIDNDIMLRDKQFFALTSEFFGTEAQVNELMQDGTIEINDIVTNTNWYRYFDKPYEFNFPSAIKAGIELQRYDVVAYDDDDDYYYISQFGNFLYYSGVAQIGNITLVRNEGTTYKQSLDFLLILNNLFITPTNDGNLVVKNRTTDPNVTVEIDSDDIIRHTSSGIIKGNPDYTSLAQLSFYSSDTIANFLNFVYKVLFATLVTNEYFEIYAKDYDDLELAEGITIDGQEYKINSIKLDNDRFAYSIKAWRI